MKLVSKSCYVCCWIPNFCEVTNSNESAIHLVDSRGYYKHIQFGMLEPMRMSCFNPLDDDRVDDELVGYKEG